ncbi:hypothetical protein [Pseudarthrobacter sp. GA104]|uniref:hypothetical protein n=1 Tax=Pseudarthrobacter sp. GA104 TaxID=2676311 RepID=UPI0012FCB80D|nr:hypothetical protein [Pseudarthrobacter sp. GA104]MUU70529.1 hypothetical protein [Pseudarthrobacter sp. GA104]
MFKRILVILAAVFTAFFLIGGPAQAAPDGSGGNPHFIKNATSASLSGSSLVVKFKETGLQSGSVETVTASASLTATYQCINNGGSNPNDPKKTTVNVDVSESGQFTADKNGNITGTLTVTPPAANTVLDCPNGQRATLTTWSYSNISVTDETSGATLSIPGTLSGGSKVN